MTTTTLTSQTSEAYKKGKGLAASNGLGLETGAKKVAKERSQTLIAKATQKSHETVVKSLAQLKLSLTESLDAISTQLTAELTTLKEVQEAIRAEQDNLNNLHDIVAEADSLQALLLAHKDQKERFEQEMVSLRAKWTEEKALHQKSEAELASEVAKRRQRDEDQYSYDTKKRRQAEDDQIQAARLTEERTHKEKLDQLSEQVTSREEAVAAQEQELVSLRAQVAQSEERSKKDVATAVAIATNSLKKDLNHDHAVEKLGLENKLSLKEAELVARQTRIDELLKQNRELDEKAKSATDKVQSIAEKAIDGAARQQTVVQMPTSESTESRRK
jgi:hypothetical protein